MFIVADITFTLMLAIVSEIEGHFHFGRNQKARYLWKVFSEHSDITKDFWDTRYRGGTTPWDAGGVPAACGGGA